MNITEEEVVLIKQGLHPKYFWNAKPIIWKNKNKKKNEVITSI